MQDAGGPPIFRPMNGKTCFYDYSLILSTVYMFLSAILSSVDTTCMPIIQGRPSILGENDATCVIEISGGENRMKFTSVSVYFLLREDDAGVQNSTANTGVQDL